jgi:hypothetical protein
MGSPFLLRCDIELYIICGMKTTRKTAGLLAAMGRIRRMERGKLCRMKGREHFNHQEWIGGRNVVRYVPRAEVEDLQKAIDGYARFMDLVRQYVDETVRITRSERQRAASTPRNAAQPGSDTSESHG